VNVEFRTPHKKEQQVKRTLKDGKTNKPVGLRHRAAIYHGQREKRVFLQSITLLQWQTANLFRLGLTRTFARMNARFFARRW
jgi:hypothetical protein